VRGAFSFGSLSAGVEIGGAETGAMR